MSRRLITVHKIQNVFAKKPIQQHTVKYDDDSRHVQTSHTKCTWDHNGPQSTLQDTMMCVRIPTWDDMRGTQRLIRTQNDTQRDSSNHSNINGRACPTDITKWFRKISEVLLLKKTWWNRKNAQKHTMCTTTHDKNNVECTGTIEYARTHCVMFSLDIKLCTQKKNTLTVVTPVTSTLTRFLHLYIPRLSNRKNKKSWTDYTLPVNCDM